MVYVDGKLKIYDGDWKEINISIDNSTFGDHVSVNYDENTTSLNLDARTWNLADWVNEKVDVTLTCSDWDKNTTKNIEVTVQDEENDRLLTYTTNIPSQVLNNQELNGTIALNDPDGNLNSSYSFDLLDENNNSIYSWTMEDSNNDWNYTFSVNLSSLNLSEGNYTFKTEAISPVVGWENPQDPVIIESNFQVLKPTFSLSPDQNVDDDGVHTIELDTNIDVSKLTYTIRIHIADTDYEYSGLKVWDTVWEDLVKLKSNWNVSFDTTDASKYWWNSLASW